METTTSQTLYEKLGGKKGITKLVDDIVEAHMENPTIKVRFLPYKEDPENLENVKSHLVDFICAGSGGSENYTGRVMESAHRGMNISEKEYLSAIDDIMKTLDRHGIEEDAKKDMLSIAYSLKDQIMRV